MLTGLNFHDEMVSMMSNVGDLGKTYTQSYNDWLDKHDKEIRADERAKTLEEVLERSIIIHGDELYGSQTKLLLFTEEAFNKVFKSKKEQNNE